MSTPPTIQLKRKKARTSNASSSLPASDADEAVMEKESSQVSDYPHNVDFGSPNRSSSSSSNKRKREENDDEDEDRPVRIYADGVFDLFHFGHAKALEQCKNLFPNVYLLVGVCDDEITHRHKGRTVMNEHERVESVRHCKHADEVVEHAPWYITQEFLDKHRIDYVAHDEAPYTQGSETGADDVYGFVKAQGKFKATQRTDGISTSDIINRLVKDYDMFVRRNLQRGYTRQEMGVGFLREKRIRVAGKVDEMKNELKTKGDGVIDSSKELLANWVDGSSKFINDFLQMFGKDGSVNQFVTHKVTSTVEDFKNFAKRTPM